MVAKTCIQPKLFLSFGFLWGKVINISFENVFQFQIKLILTSLFELVNKDYEELKLYKLAISFTNTCSRANLLPSQFLKAIEASCHAKKKCI